MDVCPFIVARRIAKFRHTLPDVIFVILTKEGSQQSCRARSASNAVGSPGSKGAPISDTLSVAQFGFAVQHRLSSIDEPVSGIRVLAAQPSVAISGEGHGTYDRPVS